MPFTDENGKVIEETNAAALRKMYANTFDAYYNALLESRRYAYKKSFFRPVLEQFLLSKEEFLKHFDEVMTSEEKVNTDDFYDSELRKAYDAISGKKDPSNERDCERFEETFGKHISGRLQKTLNEKDTRAGFNKSIEKFRLTDKAFPGIETIDPYNPNVDSTEALSEVRKGNSDTYEMAEHAQENETTRNNLFGYRSATVFSRAKASELMGKKKVTVDDLLDTFSSLNVMLRPNDPQGGQFRGSECSFGSEESGILPVTIPEDLFRTMNTVANCMNEVKETKDPLLRKSQAIQVASFAYQMLISEHVFEDGNGRSCRLLADTILQSFGLPPHTPTLSLVSSGGTIGKTLDFDNGARSFLDGIRLSDELLKLDKQSAAVGVEEQAKRYLNSAHLSEDLLQVISPKKAIGFAVNARNYVVNFMEGLDDFIKSDHFGTWNSNQYKALKEKAGALKKCLEENPLTSAKTKQAMKEMNEAIDGYERHCRRHPKNDPTRAKRLASAFKMGRAMFYLGNQATVLTKTEAGIAVKAKIQDIIKRSASSDDPAVTGDPAGRIAEYVAVKGLEEQLKSDRFDQSIDEVRDYLTMKEETVKKITSDKAFMDSVKRACQKDGFRKMTVSEQLEAFNSSYREVKREELLERQKKSREEAEARAKAKSEGNAPANHSKQKQAGMN